MARVRSTEPADGSWVRQFELAFREGRFRDAAALYDQRPPRTDSVELLLTAARARMHSSPTLALRSLLGATQSRFRGTDRIQRDVLLAEAYARTRDFAEADARLTSALEMAKATGDQDQVAMVAYRYVRRHLLDEAPAVARTFLPMAMRGRSRSARLHALFAETAILAFEERIHEQARRLLELLRQMHPERNEFHEIRLWATHALAILTRELYIPEGVAEVDRQLGGLPWPSDFAPNLFQTLKALGWAKALQGDYFNAFRHLKRASVVAPSAAWKVVAACDRSYLARRFNEMRWSRVELDEAEEIATSVDWHGTLGEERTALLLLAELFSDLDPPRSAMYLAMYRELGDIKSPLYYRHDARIRAFAKYSTGIVELGLRNTRRGIDELKEAYGIFERFGYDFRCALCLVAEGKALRDDTLLGTAREKLRNYGQSWLAAELRSTDPQPSLILPPMQQRVFEEICKGRTTADIARSFGRSEYTISNHIKQIFKAFGVGNRTALVAEAIKRGLIGTG